MFLSPGELISRRQAHSGTGEAVGSVCISSGIHYVSAGNSVSLPWARIAGEAKTRDASKRLSSSGILPVSITDEFRII